MIIVLHYTSHDIYMASYKSISFNPFPAILVCSRTISLSLILAEDLLPRLSLTHIT